MKDNGKPNLSGIKNILAKIGKFVRAYLPAIQIILVVAAVVVSVISGISQNYLSMIVTLLILIALDLIILNLGYLEHLYTKADDISNTYDALHQSHGTHDKSVRGKLADIGETLHEINDELVNNKPLIEYAKTRSWPGEQVMAAQHEVFISGVTNCTLFGNRGNFDYLGEDVTITLVSVNEDSAYLKQAYSDYYFGRLTIEDLNTQYAMRDTFIKEVAHRAKFKHRIIDTFIGLSFLGVDYHHLTNQSFITAKYYLHTDNEQEKDLYISVRPGHPLFEIYRNEMDALVRMSVEKTLGEAAKPAG